MNEEHNEITVDSEIETIKFSRIEAAANGEISEDELTEMEKEFVACYLHAYDRAQEFIMAQFENQMAKVVAELKKNDDIDPLIEDVESDVTD